MTATRLLFFAAGLGLPLYALDPCSTAALAGPYGLHLAGTSTISGSAVPFASLSRIAFDGAGGISGSSSVNFNGLLLGNPVTGTYEVKPDCTISWSLQDDSGAFQHFAGKLVPGVGRLAFHQTDPGTGGRGMIERTSDSCRPTDLRPSYTLTLSGTATPLASGDVPSAISAEGAVSITGSAGFTLTQKLQGREITADGTWSVDSDCIAHFEFALPVGAAKATVPMKLRGIVVNQGRQILAIHTDPAIVASARFTAN